MTTLLTLVQPGAPWRGKYNACRGCGTTQQPELIDGHCQQCFQDAFGPLGLDDVPPGETLMTTMTEDLPRIFREDDRLCSVCSTPKPEEDFAPGEWVKARWRVCLECQAEETPLPATPRAFTLTVPGDKPTWVAPVVALREAARATVAPALPAVPTAVPTDDDQPEWEVYTGQARVTITDPVIGWRKEMIVLPAPTLALLGKPTHVALLWDARRRLLGVRAAKPGDEGARKIPANRGATSPDAARELSATGFAKRFGLTDVPSGRYAVRQFGAVVAVQLPQARASAAP